MIITGGCLCRAIRYQVEGDPVWAVLCHCRDCQQSSGTGHVPVMGMPKASLIVSGQTTGYTARGSSGLGAVRHFCPTCGSLLFGTTEVAPDAVSIYVGTLDDPSIFRPDTVIFKRDRHPWDVTVGTLTEFDTTPAAPSDRG